MKNIQNFCVAVRGLIFRGDKILLVSQAGDFWVTPGGYVDEDESLEDALRREIKEELGLEVTEAEMVNVSEFLDSKHGNRKIEFYYLLKVKGIILHDDPDKMVLMAEYFSKEKLREIKYFPEFLAEMDFPPASCNVFAGTFKR